ncbi:MAG: FkbM family methyltransferase [Maricaulis sp.]|nr:FkbM family methyltransferase [Maricaulis sp.]
MSVDFRNLVLLPNCHVSNEIERTLDYYEKPFLEFMLEILPKFGTFIDVGAHIGNHSLFFLNRSALKVVSIEANPTAHHALLRNLATFAPDYTRSDAHNVAAGLNKGVARLHFAKNKDPGLIAAVEIIDDTPDESTTIIEMNSIDSIAPNRDVCFIKLDIEGGELLALQGAKNTIEACKPIISTECLNIEAYFALKQHMISIKYMPLTIGNPTTTIVWAHELSLQSILNLEIHQRIWDFAITETIKRL